MKKTNGSLLFSLLLATCVLLPGCREVVVPIATVSSPTATPVPMTVPQSTGVERVSVVTVKPEDFSRSAEVPATVRGFQTADLYAKVGGYIKKIHVDIGDKVVKEQPLAQLDVPEMELQLRQKQSMVRQAEAETAQAKAAVKEAKARLSSYRASVEEANSLRGQKEALVEYENREFDRLTQLAGRGAIRRELVDSARYKAAAAEAELKAVDAKVRTAEANLEGAQATVVRAQADFEAAISKIEVAQANVDYVAELIKYATIRAPWDGEVTKRMYDEGAFVQSAEGNSAAKPIFQIVRTDKLRIELALSTADIGPLSKGDRAVLSRIDALPGEEFPGEVARFSAALDEDTRMMRVEVDLENTDGKLRPGHFGYMKIMLEEFNDVPVVPGTAIQGETAKHVFLLDNGRAVKTDVTVGYNDGRQAAITSGLSTGDTVIVDGANKLSDGQAVEVK